MIRKSIIQIASILLILGMTACREDSVAPAPMPEHELFTQEEMDSFEIDTQDQDHKSHP